MSLYMVQKRVPRNDFPPISDLPLFAWEPSPQPNPSLLDIRAERVASLTGRPLSVVKIHMLVAGLGGGVR
jgi:hypothetical protein